MKIHVQQISIGDSLAWQVAAVDNHVFIKPTAVSTTNMTILTTMHTYLFQLSVTPENTAPPLYQVRFTYPNSTPMPAKITTILQEKRLHPERFNWQYSYTGDASQVPLEMFDDNQLTYLQFPQTGMSSLPAIFIVDTDRSETLVNYHVEENYLVVHRVAKQFTLRNGPHVTSLYNDKAIGDWHHVRKERAS